MTWLLLDTSCPRGVVAISSGNNIVVEVFLPDTQTHGKELSRAITQCLSSAGVTAKDLQRIVVGIGPGSFIGVRIALAHAKGMCSALSIPLMGVGTLDAILRSEDNATGSGWAVVDAKRGEVYVKHSDAGAKAQALSLDVFSQELKHRAANFVIGFGHNAVTIAIKGPAGIGLLRAANARIQLDPNIDETISLEPDYCREPDAKLPSLK